ncbi:MAG: helix-turn-helix domain-containing protein [Rhodospirillum sp.]|nr:helix-turn-helix domain-containing protein [Rhodospirillum sp.]MCF8491376.1 helix-turn-helix domain-containing protein [Rhodospirillum sp.]MCF8500200.1 helix-turn-helix domain-containing protein [Rhodospirillum sp.]
MVNRPRTLPGGTLHAALSGVAEAVGLEIAAALVAKRPGEIVYVPHEIAPDHPLALDLGLDQARRLAKHYGGDRIDVPMSLTDETLARRRMVLELRAAGWTTVEIARRARCTQRRVWQILAAESGDPRQGDMFA